MTHTIGKDVDSWCPRCKLILAHTIEAMMNHKITRTHCNTCGAQHAYRPKPPGTSTARPRSTSPSTRRAAKPAAPAPDYLKLLHGADPAKARRYNTAERFRAKEIIYHPTFGVGLVVAERDVNKIDVGFSDGMKTLTHSGAGDR